MRWVLKVFVVGGVLWFSFLLWLLPAIKEPPTWAFYDRFGEILYEEPVRTSAPLPPETLSSIWVTKALLFLEDRRFYTHIGIDPLALARAGKDALPSGKILSGVSTLPMQLAGLLFLPDRPHDGWYKWQQMLLALRIDFQWGKQKSSKPI